MSSTSELVDESTFFGSQAGLQGDTDPSATEKHGKEFASLRGTDSIAFMLRLSVSIVLTAVFLVVFLVVYSATKDVDAERQVDQMVAEASRVEAIIAEKQRENRKMRHEIRALRRDPRYLGIYARQHLNMIGPDELVLHFD